MNVIKMYFYMTLFTHNKYTKLVMITIASSVINIANDIEDIESVIDTKIVLIFCENNVNTIKL